MIDTDYPSQAQDTTIDYENDYNLYPISVSNDLGYSTTFQIYGFNGVGLGGFQLQRGLLKSVVNPNGTETRYEYDPFGRLHAVFDNEDFTGFGDETKFNGNPVVLYRYWDNTWNHDTVTWLNPAGNAPFAISEHNRHGTFNGLNGQYMFKTFTYFDGLGRPIQNQNRGVSIHGVGIQDVVTVTNYNTQGLATCTSTPFSKTHVPDSHVPGFSTTACTSVDRTTTAYDDLGRTTSVSPPSGNATTYTYGITNTVTVDGYSKLSLTNTFDAKGYMTSQFSNSLGQLVLVRDYTGTSSPYTGYSDTRYSYDLMGNLTYVKTSLKNNSQPSSFLRTVNMTYDNFGRKVAMIDPDMGTWNYTYNAMGSLVRQTDAVTTTPALCFYYDSLNRLEYKVQASSPTAACYAGTLGDPIPTSGGNHLATYTYDDADMPEPYGVGQVATIKWGADPANNQDNFHYENHGRLQTQTRTIDGRAYTMTTLTWDVLNRPLTIRTPHWFVSGQNSGYEVITLTYDHEGENTLEADNVASQSDLVTDVLYNVRGQMTGLVRGGFTTSYSYFPGNGNSGTGNNDYRLSVIAHGAAYDNLPNFSYTYDKAGNILSQTNQLTGGTSDSQNFTYDHLHRLATASGSGNISGVSGYSHTYMYDKLGNLLSMGSEEYFYNPASQPQAVKSIDRGSYTDTFNYDANGNMTQRIVNSVTYNQAFDVENRLVSVSTPGNPTTTSFAYDAAGQRTKTTVETVNDSKIVTYYPFPNYEEELVYDAQYQCSPKCGYVWVLTDTIKRSTYSLAGKPIATRITGDPNANNNSLFYFLTDHLGSTTLMTNSSGAPQISTTAYHQPYGAYRNTTPPTTDLTERGFTGHHDNSYIKLIYMNARWYDSQIGRFVSADTIVPGPSNPQAYNRYSYVLNNPLVLADPSGHCAVVQEDDGHGDIVSVRDPNDQECWDAFDSFHQFMTTAPGNLDRYWTAEDWAEASTWDKDELESKQQFYEEHGWCLHNNAACNRENFRNMINEMFPDAVLFGESGGFQGFGSTVYGWEALLSREELSVFVYTGGGVVSGAGQSLDVKYQNYGVVWNLEEHADYAGLNWVYTLDASWFRGAEITVFGAPGAIPFVNGGTWGVSAGPVVGVGASASYSEVSYNMVVNLDIQEILAVK